MLEQKFDVFLCHNSEDKIAVIKIAKQLRARGLHPWLDVWELRPGLDWQDALEAQIEQIATAAIFIGSKGMGPWQVQEVKAFLREFVERGCPVIPVLLGDAPDVPELPTFLKGKTWVDFRQSMQEPFSTLVWGITGERPNLPSCPSASDAVQINGEYVLDNRYIELDSHLKNQNWQAADQETYRLIAAEVGKEREQGLSQEDLYDFPCKTLKAIDGLWRIYSGDKFGFSVQAAMYLEYGGGPHGGYDNVAFYRLYEAVDWEQEVYSLNAPKGHLPGCLRGSGSSIQLWDNGAGGQLSTLLRRWASTMYRTKNEWLAESPAAVEVDAD